jgi:hypothetical protein
MTTGVSVLNALIFVSLNGEVKNYVCMVYVPS